MRLRTALARDKEALTAMEQLVGRLEAEGSNDTGLPIVSVGWLSYPVAKRDGYVFVSIAGEGMYEVAVVQGINLDCISSRVVPIDGAREEIARALREAERVLPARSATHGPDGAPG